jgi:pentatricopeptide repeat protein
VSWVLAGKGQECAMMPNEVVLGCMLDALVCNGEVSEAVALFREWKPKVADRPTRGSRMK